MPLRMPATPKYVPKQASIFIFGRARIVCERVFMPNVETGKMEPRMPQRLSFSDEISDYHRPRSGSQVRQKSRLERSDIILATIRARAIVRTNVSCIKLLFIDQR